MGVVAERCSLLNNPITEGVVNHYPVLSFELERQVSDGEPFYQTTQ